MPVPRGPNFYLGRLVRCAAVDNFPHRLCLSFEQTTVPVPDACRSLRCTSTGRLVVHRGIFHDRRYVQCTVGSLVNVPNLGPCISCKHNRSSCQAATNLLSSQPRTRLRSAKRMSCIASPIRTNDARISSKTGALPFGSVTVTTTATGIPSSGMLA